ncbi:MAG: endonuclease III [Nanoarchaeota archaeon]|nr:endonuclease III [Nanoarchaeota archaeon]
MGIDREKALRQLMELKKLGSLKEIRLAAEEWDKPWKILISTIMSARTRDEVTIPTATNLFREYNSLGKLAKAEIGDIQKIIKPVNFYKNKSKSIINCAKVLVRNYNGEVPLDFEELVKLPGVGRKTANVFLSELGGDNIGIDTHVSYISQKLGWTKHKDQKKIEGDLENLFLRKYWNMVNPTLVRFGKSYTSRKRKNELLDEIKNR